jgi:predicted Rossmann fold flavoprotein
MDKYDVAVIGAGAAGTMAAIRAAELGKSVILVERNNAIGKKILITGKGRCNITNTAPLEDFIEKFGKPGQFLRTAFYKFFNEDLMAFFRSKGLDIKVERQGRVFPVTDKANSVVDVLKKCLADNNVKMLFNSRVSGIKKNDNGFELILENGDTIAARRVIIAAGGASYAATGSTGDGFDIAKKLGHDIIALKPGLVPLTTKEKWVKDLQGVALENIRIRFECGKKKIESDVGELMFTHFGVSGPLVLDLSGEIMSLLEVHKEVKLYIDLKPGMREEQLDSRLIHKFKTKGESQIKNIMKDVLPNKLIEIILRLSDVPMSVETNQVTQDQRRSIIKILKAMPLTITGSLPLEEAMVTGGGVSIKEIDPRTMQSKIAPGLYFAGEVIEGFARSGGYNLQQAFSTGYLAGESAARVLGHGSY